MNGTVRARVFISCGQRDDCGETKVAHEISRVLEEMDFDPYIAIREQSPRGLKENIFQRLGTSEYFLFLDFAREQFANCPQHRGSLFTNQELAIASYLDIEVICFQQEGVRPRDGVLGAIQANIIPFQHPAELCAEVKKTVKDRGWRTGWRRQLTVMPSHGSPVVAASTGADAANNVLRLLYASYHHLEVRNLHHRLPALGCTAYVESIRNVSTGETVPIETVELKWAGCTVPSVAVMPNGYRKLDALHVWHHDPCVACFNVFADSTQFIPGIRGPAHYEVSYMVISANFPIVRATCEVRLGKALNEVVFQVTSAVSETLCDALIPL